MAFKKKIKGTTEEGGNPSASMHTKPRKSGASLIKRGGKDKQFVMLIGDEGAILVFMEGSKVVRRLFAPSAQPSSTEAMLTLMNGNPKVPVSLLVDSLDQQYVRQSFPPVSSLSVNGLVKRRLDRDFQPEDLKGSLPLGRDKTGRKEWNFLLISLAKTATLTEWIDLVSDLPNELKGIYLVPVEGTMYVRMLSGTFGSSHPQSWQLVVTHNKISGFRQIVVNQGKLVFTRVSQAIDDAIPAVIAGNIEQEIINTIEYLKRLGFQDNSGLDIFVVASPDVNEALDLKRFNSGFSRALTPLDVAEGLGLEQAALSADRFGDVVLASAFVRAKKKVLRFSTAYIDSLKKMYGISKATKVAAALISILLLGLSVQNLMGMMENQSQAAESSAKRAQLQGRLSELKNSIAGLNQNIAMKATAVNLYDAYLKDSHAPLDFVQLLLPLITPEQRILSFTWTTQKPSEKSQSSGANQGANAGDQGPITIAIDFEFKGAYKTPDALSKAAQAFLDNLAEKLPEYTVSYPTFPWKVEEAKNLEISFDQQQPTGIKEGENHLIVTFSGPLKKSTTNAQAGGGNP